MSTPANPRQNALAWLWQAIEAHNPALYRELRAGHIVQQRLYNAWCKKERARKDLAAAERRLALSDGEERPGKYTITHYRRRYVESERKLKEMLDALAAE